MTDIVSMFDKFGYAGVIVIVLGWFMLRMENVIKGNTDAVNVMNATMVKVCVKLGVNDDE